MRCPLRHRYDPDKRITEYKGTADRVRNYYGAGRVHAPQVTRRTVSKALPEGILRRSFFYTGE